MGISVVTRDTRNRRRTDTRIRMRHFCRLRQKEPPLKRPAIPFEENEWPFCIIPLLPEDEEAETAAGNRRMGLWIRSSIRRQDQGLLLSARQIRSHVSTSVSPSDSSVMLILLSDTPLTFSDPLSLSWSSSLFFVDPVILCPAVVQGSMFLSRE